MGINEGRFSIQIFLSIRFQQPWIQDPYGPRYAELMMVLVENPDPEGPFGAKGMSEGYQIAPAPAIANAIYHAIGVRVKELLIIP